MTSEEILHALRSGEISLEDAKKALTVETSQVLGDGQKEALPGAAREVEPVKRASSAQEAGRRGAVAIVGMSARYPDASSLSDFWGNLVQGKNAIREIPLSRFNIADSYDQSPESSTKTRCHWLGALDGIEYFDPLFFRISPAEAEGMDPRQRLFLEEGYKAFEDAGYSPGLLSNRKCGVYLGILSYEYALSLSEEEAAEMNLLGGSSAIAAARIAYHLNLKGPAIAIDTACSSSLVATHLACQALASQEIDMALVGGVSLCLTSGFYVGMYNAGMLSPDGQCKTFDASANGFVPGEGVGALVLKRLADAEADHDQIYGVIIGSGMNQDGATNGITAPSAKSQVELAREIYEKYQIAPESISYVEMHGTGTKLGDPIELQALATVFQEQTQRKQYCAIGSVKSNIGHTLAAAGVASLHKVLLAMKQKKLVPSLHFERPNPHFDFEASPFYVNTEVQDWKSAEGMPRRAAVSSFGFSGTNAHMVVEEYIPVKEEEMLLPRSVERPSVFVLSAQSESQLKSYAQEMNHWIQAHSEQALEDIAFTLQVGRVSMEYRLAIIANSREILLQRLEAFVDKQASAGVYTAQGEKKPTSDATLFEADADGQSLLHIWCQKKNLEKLAQVWVRGVNVDWMLLYGENLPHRISLPTYSFAHERYLFPLPTSRGSMQIQSAASSAVTASLRDKSTSDGTLHPLVQRNTSTLWEQQFSSTFSGDEFFLADHVLNGLRIMPGVAYLEMAYIAVREAIGADATPEPTPLSLSHVVWARPLIAGEHPITVHITLSPQEDGTIAFLISQVSPGEEEGTEVLYSQGRAVLRGERERQQLDLAAIQARCQDHLSASSCYQRYRELGFSHGPAYQGIEHLSIGEGEVLARLREPLVVAQTLQNKPAGYGFVLRPSILDSAVQAMVLLTESAQSRGLWIPFALEELSIVGEVKGSGWAWVRRRHSSATGQVFDIEVCDDEGQLAVSLRGLSVRRLHAHSEERQTVLLTPSWKEEALSGQGLSPEYSAPLLVLLYDLPNISTSRIQGQLADGGRCRSLHSEQSRRELRFQDAVVQLIQELGHLWGRRGDAIGSQPTGAVQVQVVVAQREEPSFLEALAGVLKTAQQEYPHLWVQLIEVDEEVEEGELLIYLRENQLQRAQEPHIRYSSGKRWVREWQEHPQESFPVKMPWKEGGCYLISGGAGGLARLFVQEIARQVETATVILVGRSALSEEQRTQLEPTENGGIHITYQRTDVSDRFAVHSLIHRVVTQFGHLDGIVHAAGVLRDSLLLNKTPEEVEEVLSPKVLGVEHLDEASQDLPLDFFVLCSSLSAVMGNMGQADYAAANAYLDAFAHTRTRQVLAGERQGTTVSINWPLWEEGGMQIEAEVRRRMREQLGIEVMGTQTGMETFSQALTSGFAQVTVAHGQVERIKRRLQHRSSVPSGGTGQVPHAVQTTPVTPVESATSPDAFVWQDRLREALTSIVSRVFKVRVEEINTEKELSEYGFDSITATGLANQLNQTYKLDLTPPIFFQHSTIELLLCHLHAKYAEVIAPHFAATSPVAPAVTRKNAPAEPVKEGAPGASVARQRSRVARLLVRREEEQAHATTAPIAIIGMSGAFPQAPDVQRFWHNLLAGRDCIGEIPASRWDRQTSFGNPATQANKVKWAGITEDVELFDPLFFGISRAEAEQMDPQQRLLMISVWRAIEDAGYSASSLSGTNTALFVGTINSGYSERVSRTLEIKGYSSTGQTPSVGPNRMSYFLNLHGPSEAIETACSSSLIAIHRGVNAIESGQCAMAIVGGVNTLVSPELHISFSKAGMLCEDGRCKTFSASANGYVRGEGVGMLLLKKLSDAEQAGDHIYGVIRSTAENHGGRASSLTAPNPRAQADLLIAAYRKAGIDPRTVGYIEAHGTGTPLGDPIEINGLKTAFSELARSGGEGPMREESCGVGSVKSNIGHLEVAAGVAGVIKVLLQLQHKQLVKSLHCEQINPYIQLEGSPFYIVQENREWEALQDSTGEVLPRRAGVSSFGFGGANAHVVLEEYVPKPRATLSGGVASQRAIIVLSAKNEERLNAQVRQLLAWVRTQTCAEQPQVSLSNQSEALFLQDVAYTLQVGREAMEERLALQVSGLSELEEKLQGYLQDPREMGDWHRGQVRRHDAISAFAADEVGQQAVAAWMNRGQYEKLQELWVKGLTIDWQLLYGEERPHRISLPTYPFARERYWISPAPSERAYRSTVGAPSSSGNVLQASDALPHASPQPETGGDLSPASLIKTNGNEEMSQELKRTVLRSLADSPVLSGSLPLPEGDRPQPSLTQASSDLIRSGRNLSTADPLRSLQSPPVPSGLTSQRVILEQPGGVDDLTISEGALPELQEREVRMAVRAFSLNFGDLLCVQGLYPTMPPYPFTPGFEASGVVIDIGRAVTAFAVGDPVMALAGATLGAQATVMTCPQEHVLPKPDSLSFEEACALPVVAVTMLAAFEKARLKQGEKILIQTATGGTGLIAIQLAKHYGAQIYATAGSQAKLDYLKHLGVPYRINYREIDFAQEIERLTEGKGVDVVINTLSGDAIQKGMNCLSSGGRYIEIAMTALKSARTIDLSVFSRNQTFYSVDLRKVDPAALKPYCDEMLQLVEEGIITPTISRVFAWDSLKEAYRFMEDRQHIGKIVVRIPQANQASQETDQQQRSMVAHAPRVTALYASSNKRVSSGSVSQQARQLEEDLSRSLAQVLYLKQNDIDVEKSFAEMGMDSLIGVEWIKMLNNQYAGKWATTSIYDYPTIRQMAHFLQKELLKQQQTAVQPLSVHSLEEDDVGGTVRSSYPLQEPIQPSSATQSPDGPHIEASPTAPGQAYRGKHEEPHTQARAPEAHPACEEPILARNASASKAEQTSRESTTRESNVRSETIAIVGMSGKYPDTRNLSEYWENLVQAKNAVREIPHSRFNVSDYYDQNPAATEKISCKWLGVLDEIEYFDPLFFHLSPAEAVVMDPQHRLFLEEGYKAFEDAGYSPGALSNSKCGVYLGIASQEYGQLLSQQKALEMNLMGTSSAIAAARIAYLLNLKGPAIAIDTACSSSLVATHLACQALRCQEIDLALVGGVSLCLTPDFYVGMCSAGMLSPDGQCKTFDASANGFVPGEGVGALVLKRLADAEADQDQIYGVIIASGINQDGATNGITAPSVKSQIELEHAVYEKYQIDPASISYVEMHGTGTKLGDPIELEALATVFQEKTQRKQYCAIGSVKTNIGHTLAAAGVAGLQKVLLAMKHRKLVPSLHFEQPNPHFDFETSPFYVNTEVQDWKSEAGRPLRTAVSSFGFSGTNAHLVVEEYLPARQEEGSKPHPSRMQRECLLVLSAKSESQLRSYAQEMKRWIQAHAEQALPDIAFTLQVGRAALDYRLAIVADSREVLLQRLEAFVDNQTSPGVHTAQVKKGTNDATLFEADADGQSLLLIWCQKKDLEKLAQVWVRGVNVDWMLLHTAGAAGVDRGAIQETSSLPTLIAPVLPRRISLPTYPFARERYWLPPTTPSTTTVGASLQATVPATLHPLVQRNTSTLWEEQFSSTFHGNEFFLADHVISGQRILPGVAYLEMARAAVRMALGADATPEAGNLHLHQVVWTRPLAVGEQPVAVQITLSPQESGTLAFLISRADAPCAPEGSDPQEEESTELVYCQGMAELRAENAEGPTESQHLDVQVVLARCPHQISGTEIYQRYRELGISYGPAYQGIEHLSVGDGEMLARFRLPSVVAQTRTEFVLHPSVLDAALHASIGLLIKQNMQMSLQVPFALSDLSIEGSVPTQGWTWIRRSPQSMQTGAGGSDLVSSLVLDVEVCDDTGRVAVRLRGLSTRPLSGSLEALQTRFLTPDWKEEAVAGPASPSSPAAPASDLTQAQAPVTFNSLVLLCGLPDLLASRIQAQMPSGGRCRSLSSSHLRRDLRFQDMVVQLIQELQHLLHERPAGLVLVQVVVAHKPEPSLLEALLGVLKVAQQEYPTLLGQLIEVEEEPEERALLVWLRENQLNVQEPHVRYRNGKRWVRVWQEHPQTSAPERLPWKEGGCYLITGGAGGLAQLFVQEIARQVQEATVILIGRSALSREQQAQVEGRKNRTLRLDYQQVDVSDGPAVHALIERVFLQHGHLDGIIHAAGVLRDNLLLNKTPEEVQAVLSPKVVGVEQLDEASAEIPLDFFALCSSMSAVVGNVGQVDYAAANAYLDAFAHARQALVLAGERQGATVSINWPLWEEGGMHIDASTLQMMQERVGIVPMDTETGMKTLYQALALGTAQVVVLHGQVERIKQQWLHRSPVSPMSVESSLERTPPSGIEEGQQGVSTLGEEAMGEKARAYFKKHLAAFIKLPAQQIEASAPLLDYGVDSIMATRFTNVLERSFGPLSKTLLFEHPTLDSVSRYFLRHYPEQLRRVLGIEEATVTARPRITRVSGDGTQILLPTNKRNNYEKLSMQDPLQRLEHLSPEKKQILIKVLKEQEPRFNVFPVSSAQQRMWVLNQLAPESTAYLIGGGFRFLGTLDELALQHSLDEIVRRHEALRTVFVASEGEPVQLIQPPSPLALSFTDLSAWPLEQREHELQTLMQRELQTPFSLAQGPLVRSALVRLAPQDHVLWLTVHHIVFDGWSHGVLTREFVQLYEAFSRHQPSPLIPLPLQYADFARWQRDWLTSQQMHDHLAYWRVQLSDLPAPIELLLDHPRPAMQTFAGAAERLVLPAALARQLLTLSQQEGATLFMTLLSAFQIVLARYSGQRDLVIGTPIANRTRAELEELIGCFINTLVIRTRLEMSSSFRTLLQQVRQTTLDAYAHQEVPFEKLVEELQPERDPSRTPLFQHLFALQNVPQSSLRLEHLTVQPFPAPTYTAQFDLSLHLWEQEDGLEGILIYNTDLFEYTTIARLASHFQHVLEVIAANPEVRLTEIDLLTQEERQLLQSWNQTELMMEEADCIPVLIERQAARTPEGLALLSADGQRSYRELNQEANQLARRLLAMGVGAEVLVGVSMHRSIELVVALLAILKAGGIYVPLDPEYPTERLSTLIADAGLEIVLTQSAYAERFAQQPVHLLLVEPGWNADLESGEANLDTPISGEQGAYMIYTSGSTGQPKGVINTHQGLTNRLLWGQRTYPLTTDDRVLQKTTLTFDASVSEFFWPLLAGATLVLAQPGGQQDPAYLVEAIEQYQITSIYFVPSMFSLFLQQPQLAQRCRSLRQVFTGGEALSAELAERFFVAFPASAVRLHNLYGPTEAAIEVTAWECERETLQQFSGRGVPIGRPIANVQTYILDEQMQSVPIGAPGELHLGGIALARGYHRRPELTEQKFVSHPFVPGQRLYKTGDRARYRHDGAIEFLGRLDQQVKLRGLRIELGEIEALLEQSPVVCQAVVVLREDHSGEKQLVAYVVPQQAGVEPAQLKQELRQRVPNYLVPATIVLLEELPMLSSGKVDRKRLPQPQQDRSQVMSTYQAPRTALEQQLIAIWQEVLGRQPIGIQDNFFELGGHSLKAIQMLAYVREKVQKTLLLGHFFQAQTIAEMAALIDRNDESTPLLVPIRKIESTYAPLFLFHPTGGEIFVYRDLVEHVKQAIPVYGLQSRALLGTKPEHISIEAMADEYVTAIRQQQPTGPYFLLGWSMGGGIAIAVASRLESANQEVRFVGLVDSYLIGNQSDSADDDDPLVDLALAFGGKLVLAFANLGYEEQEQLREAWLAVSERECFQQVLRWGQERKLFPENLSIEPFLSRAALVNTHRTLLKEYQAPYIKAPLVVWWASESKRSRTNWGNYTRDGLQERVIDGNHFTIMQPPSIELVAQELGSYLTQISFAPPGV